MLQDKKGVKGEIMPKHTILVVDDNEIVLAVIESALEKSGYNVYSAGDIPSCLEIFQAHQDEIDLVITDVRIGDESGFKLADTLEQEFGFRSVIFITAFFWEEEVLDELLNRGKPFFEKPLKFEREVFPALNDFFGEKYS
jgi:two-component system response regulator PilR (NtrC family)